MPASTIIASESKHFNAMNIRLLYTASILLVLLAGCQRKDESPAEPAEDKAAKEMLQGIWVDDDTDEAVLKVVGDTIFYPDSTSQPAYFKILADTLIMSSSESGYAIVKRTANLFWFHNQNGDVIKLHRSSSDSDSLAFAHRQPKALSVSEVVKKDTVVNYRGERYHCYIAINPTKYKVIYNSINNDGVGVDNICYDNIIHISVYHGAEKIFSSDFRKSMYHRLVPGQFLSQSILGNADFSKVDSRGFHFDTTICIPDGASCYLLDTQISFDGKMSMELLEY